MAPALYALDSDIFDTYINLPESNFFPFTLAIRGQNISLSSLLSYKKNCSPHTWGLRKSVGVYGTVPQGEVVGFGHSIVYTTGTLAYESKPSCFYPRGAGELDFYMKNT